MRILFLSACLFLSASIYGQGMNLKGAVRDSLADIGLAEATVAVMDARDSILVSYAYTGIEGQFEFNLTSGNYLLMVSYPGYADYITHVSVIGQTQIKPIEIHLSLKSKLLEEVIVNAKPMAFVVKGDTVEFNAAAYTIAPNAKVEELLRQLPGIEIDFNGRIKAYGQAVDRVLVDGEEFFGDDPTLITRNLRGDMVEKVQLYDKKSDLAELTKTDIGEKEKTINIKLRDDKKNGHFGKVDAGKGTADYYQGQAMFNRFTERSKFAIYGNAATTGLVDLRSADRNKFGVTGGTIEFVNGNIFLSGVKYDELSTNSGSYEGIGKPRVLSGGVHYDRKWDNDRQRVNANFKTGDLEVNGHQTTFSENTIPETVLISNSGQQFKNTISRNRIDVAYEYEPDTVTKIKFSIEGLKRKTQRSNSYDVSVKNELGRLVSESNRSLNEQGQEDMFDFGGTYSRKLNNNGRSLSVNLGSSYGDVRSDGLLNATSVFLTETGESEQKVIDQSINNDLRQHVITGTATYTDRITDGMTAILSYGIGNSQESTERMSFDGQGPSGQLTPLPEFSVDFILNQLSNHLDLTLHYKLNNHTIEVGNQTALVNFRQRDRSNHKNLNRDFLTWNPEFSYRYRPTGDGLLSISYAGMNLLPTSSQLQPAQINDDPLNIVAGNPDLKPAYLHHFTANYYFFRPTSGVSLNLLSGFYLTKQPIANSILTDKFGKSVYTPINLSGVEETNFMVRLHLGKQLKKLKLFTGLTLNVSSSNIYGESNGTLQKRTIQKYATGINISRHRAEYFISLIVSPYYSRNYSNLNNLLNNNGGGVEGELSFGITLPADFRLSGSGQYEYQEKTETFSQGIDLFTVSTALEKKFLRSKVLSLTLSVNDLLNQNQGFNRSSIGTTVTQNIYTTIQRYYMLSLAWDFAKFGNR